MLDNRAAFALLVAVAVVAAVLWAVLRIRRRRKPRIHPKLQKYAGDDSDRRGEKQRHQRHEQMRGEPLDHAAALRPA